MITDPAPLVPTPDAHSVIRDTYEKWLSDRTTVRCIMLEAMNDKFHHKFEQVKLEDILQILRESRHPPFEKGTKENHGVQSAETSQTLKCRVDKSQAEMLGHWKENYSLDSFDPYRQREGKQQVVAVQGAYMITPCSFSICDTTNWVLDTGSPVYICNSLH